MQRAYCSNGHLGHNKQSGADPYIKNVFGKHWSFIAAAAAGTITTATLVNRSHRVFGEHSAHTPSLPPLSTLLSFSIWLAQNYSDHMKCGNGPVT